MATKKIKIDTSKGLNMSEEEKDGFITLMNLANDWGMVDDISDDDIRLYHMIFKERRDK